MRDLEHLRRRYADHVPGLLGARHSYAVLCPLVERPDGLHLLFEGRSAALHRQPRRLVDRDHVVVFENYQTADEIDFLRRQFGAFFRRGFAFF